ncbi:hypothetical protein B2A_03580, partial [mine drainage metagenome]
FMIAVAIFMFGVALKNDRLRTFGIGEIYEALASLVIVVFFLIYCSSLFWLDAVSGVRIHKSIQHLADIYRSNHKLDHCNSQKPVYYNGT